MTEEAMEDQRSAHKREECVQTMRHADDGERCSFPAAWHQHGRCPFILDVLARADVSEQIRVAIAYLDKRVGFLRPAGPLEYVQHAEGEQGTASVWEALGVPPPPAPRAALRASAQPWPLQAQLEVEDTCDRTGQMYASVRRRPTSAFASVPRRTRSVSIGRGQRHCTGCGHFLPMAWNEELCAKCSLRDDEREASLC